MTCVFGRVACAVLLLVVLAACQTDSRAQLLATSESQVALRTIQTRVFDTIDRELTLRTAIGTLQDLGFVIDAADADLGAVSATKLDRYMLRMTVTVRPRGQTQMLVRANAQYQDEEITEPGPYRHFFVALEKAMFLTAQHID